MSVGDLVFLMHICEQLGVGYSIINDIYEDASLCIYVTMKTVQQTN